MVQVVSLIVLLWKIPVLAG